jgi:hypothetical protein
MSQFGLKGVIATPRTLVSNWSATPTITLPATASITERVYTQTRPATTTTGNGAGIIVNPTFNFLRITPLVSGSGTAYTLNILGWTFNEVISRWYPIPIVSQPLTNATTGSFAYPLGGSPPTVFGAVTIADPTTAGNRTRYPGFAGGSRYGTLVVDCIACDLVELIFSSSVGGEFAGAFIGEF